MHFVSDICSSGNCSHSIPESLGYHGNQFWRVRAFNPAGWGAYEPDSASASSTNVNDWGSGFNASFECELPGSGSITDFLIDINYSGSANLTNSWMQGYGGGITFGNLASDGGYAIEPSGYVPPLNAGDTLTFTVQGSGSGYAATDFDVQCVTGGGL